MKAGPNISRIAALIGDPARCNMLTALMDGRALTASELANQAGITRQTASSHLAQLLDGGLLAREIQGRHHYFRLDGADIGQALEALMGVAQKRIGTRTRTGPKDPALRHARVCYDHLAGDLGVFLFDRMLAKAWLVHTKSELHITENGWHGLQDINIRENSLPTTRRPQCRACLDWSARRHHLAGQIGQLVLDQVLAQQWARRQKGSRVIAFSSAGEKAFRNWLA
jgi:DNA-binding transcriptional ArsR family regulator